MTWRSQDHCICCNVFCASLSGRTTLLLYSNTHLQLALQLHASPILGKVLIAVHPTDAIAVRDLDICLMKQPRRRIAKMLPPKGVGMKLSPIRLCAACYIPEFDITEIAKILFQLGLRDFMLGFFLLLIENILNKESKKPAVRRSLALRGRGLFIIN